MQQGSYERFIGRGERRNRKGDREKGREGVGISVWGQEWQKRKRKKAMGGGQGLAFIKELSKCAQGCSYCLQLRTYPDRTLRAGQYRYLNINNVYYSPKDFPLL